MLHSELRPSTHVVEAEWLARRLRAFGSGVTSIVPDGFAAYVRILHPARAAGVNDEPVTWAEVATRSGRTMHRLAQFHAIAGTDPLARGSPSPFGVSAPENGNLPPHLLNVLCAVLAENTSTEESCWFCLWDGYGWVHGSPAVSVIVFTPPGDTSGSAGGEYSVPPALPPEVLRGPRVSLPYRKYFLFEGPLHAARELGWTTPWRFQPQSPNLFWPQDHAWCVATEIDLFCTLVAGSEQLVQALVAEPRLEAWRVFPDDPITWDSDKVNT